MAAVHTESKTPPYLIVIDALDEINGDGESVFLRDLLINEYNGRELQLVSRDEPNHAIPSLPRLFVGSNVYQLRTQLDINTHLKIKLLKLAGSPTRLDKPWRQIVYSLMQQQWCLHFPRSQFESRQICTPVQFIRV